MPKPQIRGGPYVLENGPDPERIDAIAGPIARQMIADITLPSGFASKKGMCEYAMAFGLLMATLLEPLEGDDQEALAKVFERHLNGYLNGLRADPKRRQV